MDVDSPLVKLCIEAACENKSAVDRWRLQRRTLQRLPSPIASSLFHRLLHRRLLFPSLLEIFKYSVDEVDLSGENSVDVEWMAYLGAYPYLRSLNVANCYRINNAALWPLAGSTSLKELDLSKCSKVTDAGVKHLLSISQLEKLNLLQTGITANGVKLLSGFQNLSRLDLGGLPVSDQALSSLEVLTKLEYLDLWGGKISDEGAVTFKKFPLLNFLGLAWTKVTKLPNMKSLRSLDVSYCSIHSFTDDNNIATLQKLISHGTSFLDAEKAFSNIEASSLVFLNLSSTFITYVSFLCHMHALEHLDLSFSCIQDDAIETIACVSSNLRHLNLSKTKISSVGLEILAGHVPNLEELLLCNTLIDDRAIAYISLMPSMKSVDLSNTNIRGFIRQIGNEQDEFLSLTALQNLKHLESLNLEGTRVADESLHMISGFEELRHLSLGNTPITDGCLDFLSSVKKLVNLSIRGAVLTNGALDAFNPPATLEVLDLRNCWLLTVDYLTLFCEKHPNIQVRHDHLPMPSMEHRDSHSHTSSSQKGSNLSKQKVTRLPESSLFKKDILDQRIKYGKDELLALQHLPSLPLPPPDIITELLKLE